MITIKAVEAKKNQRIDLWFSDGQHGELDLSRLAAKGVFRKLAGPAIFRKVRIGNDGRSLCWPGDLDLCADALYQRLTGRLPWEVPERKLEKREATATCPGHR